MRTAILVLGVVLGVFGPQALAVGAELAPPLPEARLAPRPAVSPQADDLASAPRISQAAFAKALAAGDILVIDVRDGQAYANGHIPGAISIPLDSLSGRVTQLKAEKRPIVTYCA